jgi:ornithine cyclodeaminase/alanine dehydrogenase
MKEAIKVVEDSFRQLSLGNVRMPTRTSTPIPSHNGLLLSMPAYVGGETDALGEKVVTIYPENPSKQGLPTVLGLLQLLDAKTGNCISIMEAGALTAIRTGAASAVATKYLTEEDSRSMALFGVGGQARTQLEAISLIRKIEQVKVYAPRTEHVKAFCERVAQDLDAKLIPAENPRQAIEGCDIIVCATSSQTPVFNGEWLRPGMHINGIGSHTARARELDTVTILRGKLVVDSVESALAEAGDVIIPLTEGAISRDHILAELGEIVSGRKSGRTSDQDITIFKSVGLAAQDIACGKKVYDEAVRGRKGLLISRSSV